MSLDWDEEALTARQKAFVEKEIKMARVRPCTRVCGA
jgi:hypothetical protein